MTEKVTVGTRLKQIMLEKNLKQVDILNKTIPLQAKYNVRIAKNDLSQYVNDKVEPNQERIFILANALDVTEPWLMGFDVPRRKTTVLSDTAQAIVDVSVQLEMPRQHNVLTYAKTQLDEQNNVISFADLKEEEATYQSIYLYGAASAGKGLDLYDEVVEEIKYPKPVPTHDIALRVHGDSMDPMFRDGEIIFVKKSHEINHGQIGVFILNGQGYLKKFYRDVDGLKLVSLNKNYPDIIVQEFDEIQLTGVVVM